MLHCRQAADEPVATDAPTRSSAAVLGSRADVPATPSPSPASPSMNPSSIIVSLRKISWNLTVWSIPLRSSPGAPVQPAREHLSSARWDETRSSGHQEPQLTGPADRLAAGRDSQLAVDGHCL